MQTQVFNLSCSSDSCHSSIGRAGDLVLQEGYSWDSLVNHKPSNPVAAADGLMRVMPGNPDMSLLMAKISSNLQAGEGQSMPFNSAPLTTDTIDVVGAWIKAGAPQDGVVPGDDGRPLGDSGDPSGPFSLQPPDHGVQIKTTSPPVPIGREETGCHYLKMPSDVDLDVNRIQVAVTGGSHHIHLYRAYDPTLDLPDGYEVCNHAVDFDVWELVVAVQLRRTDWELPPGVAFHFRKGEQLLMQTHFVNVGALETQGDGIAIMNLQAAEPGTVTDYAGAIFGQDKDVDVLPHSSPTLSAECVFPKALNLMAETGHYHFRGRHFSTYLWNDGVRGDKIYDYDGYNDPPFVVHDPAIEFAAGGGLQWECHWVNDTDNEYKFGPFTDTNEHCNWFGFYYPTESQEESITCVKQGGVATTTVRTIQ
jgi:copper type II ascorbate-dependent monooxygenase-like protein